VASVKATGDGLAAAVAAGAAVVDLRRVQLHPTAFLDPKDPNNPSKVRGESERGGGWGGL
jgi:aspartate oxidase